MKEEVLEYNYQLYLKGFKLKKEILESLTTAGYEVGIKKIRIKNTASGKVIEFSGECNKGQLETAKVMAGAEEIVEE